MKANKWDIDAERDLWRALCAPNRWFGEDGEVSTHPDALWWFVKLAWGADFFLKKHPEQPRWLTEHIHRPFLKWLQHHILAWKYDTLHGSTDRRYIACVIPRGFGKTVTATKSAGIWAHLDEPDMSSLICSANSDLSEDVFKAIKAVLAGTDEDSWFTWLYGNWKHGSQEWKGTSLKHGFRSAHNLSEPSFDTTSVEVGMTGYHHRIHIWDDPIFKNKLREGREAYMRTVHSAVDASYNALQTNGLMMFVLTRYLDDDVAGRHFRNEGIATWSGMPCPNYAMFTQVAMGEGNWHVYFFQTEDEITGEPTHPTLYDEKKIAEHKRRDPEDFACQQQNNPGSGERAPLLESQLQDIFLDYKDFQYDVPVEAASVHIDTAFKTLKTIRTGDYNAIVVWLHDARRNGMVYLDSDLLQASDEWREEDFNEILLKTLLRLRRRLIRVKALTDEMEFGGKAGSYRNRILSLVAGTGVSINDNNFKQLNRQRHNKEARIRVAIGYWVEGYVRILLHKDKNGKWVIPKLLREFFNQHLRVGFTQHDDLADAASDVFTPGIWLKPMRPGVFQDEGANPWMPGDENLKELSRPLSNEEVFAMIEDNKVVQETMGPGHGWTQEDYSMDIPRDPV